MTSVSRSRLLIFGNIYFVVYTIFACVFYKERIFLDGSYYFFHVVQSENFRVEHQRFILIISQLLAWIGVKLHLPLWSVMMLNSINPVLYLWTLFILCAVVLNDKAAGWSLLLLSVCGIYFIYFCPMYEVWYGGGLLIFFGALLYREFYRTTFQLIALGITSITLLFSYPLMIAGFLFFIFFSPADKRWLPISAYITFIISVAVWLLWKLLFISDYESGKISYPLSQLGNTLKSNFGSPNDILSLLKFLFSVYGEEMIMFIGTVVALVLRRDLFKAVLLFIFVSGFILLVNITQSQPWLHSNYFERMYLLLIPICTLPFLREIYSPSRMKIFFEIAFFGIIFLRGFLIVQHSSFYTKRIKNIFELVSKAQQQGGSKFYVDPEHYPGNAAMNEWSFPIETLLFSSLNNNSQSIIISLKEDIEQPEVASKLNDKTFHLRLNEVMNEAMLNQHYFHMKDGPTKKLED